MMENESNLKPTYTAGLGTWFLACIMVAVMSASTEAQVFYDFVNDPPIAVRARLELSSLPATYAEVVELTFTPEGDVFGLGPSVSGPFHFMTFSTVTETLPMNLGCTGCAVSHNGHQQSFMFKQAGFFSVVLGMEVSFVLGFGNVAGGDSFGFTNLSPPVFTSRLFNGDWIRVIPEPTTAALALAALCLAMSRRRSH